MLYAQVAQEEEGEPTRRKRKEKSETLEKFFRKLGFGVGAKPSYPCDNCVVRSCS